jgi:hypothetical protein
MSAEPIYSHALKLMAYPSHCEHGLRWAREVTASNSIAAFPSDFPASFARRQAAPQLLLRVIFFRHDTLVPTAGLPSKAESLGHAAESGSLSPR